MKQNSDQNIYVAYQYMFITQTKNKDNLSLNSNN